MDSSVSAKDEIWFLRVCHHVSNAVCMRTAAAIARYRGKFGVFSAATKHHRFTLGTDGLLRWPPYLAIRLE
jgi:hypothetical protein